MTGSRRWWWRVLAGVVGVAGAETIALIAGSRVDHLGLVMVVALVVATAGLIVDAAQGDPLSWHLPPERGDEQGSADPRTASYLRILESHLTAREPDGTVRDRLGDLADQVLRIRHDLRRADPGAAALLGPELQRVLVEPPRRLGVDEIDRCVRRIEEL